MEELERKSDGSAGPPGSAQPKHQNSGAEAGNVVNGEGLSIVPATPEQRAAIDALPDGRQVWLSGLKWAGKFVLLATLSGGLACGMAPHGARDGHHHGHHGGRKPGPAHSAQHPANGGRRREEDGPVEYASPSTGESGEGQTSNIQPSTPNIQGETAEILQLARRQMALLEQLVLGQGAGVETSNIQPPTSNVRGGSKTVPPVKTFHAIGRFQYAAGFWDVWLGGEHYDLRGRNKARLCLQYLVEQHAFDPASARHLETEIEPFVRKQCRLSPLPDSARTNLRIQHFFNDPSRKLSRLRRELVKAAGRNGRFFLQVN
jgi:hypothetical protein